MLKQIVEVGRSKKDRNQTMNSRLTYDSRSNEQRQAERWKGRWQPRRNDIEVTPISGSKGARHKLHHSRGARSSAESNLAGDEAQVMILVKSRDSSVIDTNAAIAAVNGCDNIATY